jgi:hypothetical protein
VPVERLLRILTRLAAGGEDDRSASHLPEACAELISMTGAVITVGDDAAAPGAVYSSDAVSAQLADLEMVLGEGPGVDAQHAQHLVEEPDVTHPAEQRWPAFAAGADTLGVSALFAVPVAIGDSRVGGLTLYRDRPGPLTLYQQEDLVVLGEVTAKALLNMQLQSSGNAADGLGLADLTNFRAVVHQASGMIAVQQRVSIGEALSRLRAHAFATDVQISDVATNIVSRRLRLSSERSEP